MFPMSLPKGAGAPSKGLKGAGAPNVQNEPPHGACNLAAEPTQDP